MQKVGKISVIVFAALIALGIIYFLGYERGKRGVLDSIDEQESTVVIKDTTFIYVPTPIKEYVDHIVYLPVHDTLLCVVNDTTYISLPYSIREYEDSTYFCRIGGYSPELLELHTFSENTITTRTIVQKEKNHRLYLGATLSQWENTDLVPAIGYEFIKNSWVLSAELGYNTIDKSPIISLNAKFSIFSW